MKATLIGSEMGAEAGRFSNSTPRLLDVAIFNYQDRCTTDT